MVYGKSEWARCGHARWFCCAFGQSFSAPGVAVLVPSGSLALSAAPALGSTLLCFHNTHTPPLAGKYKPDALWDSLEARLWEWSVGSWLVVGVSPAHCWLPVLALHNSALHHPNHFWTKQATRSWPASCIHRRMSMSYHQRQQSCPTRCSYHQQRQCHPLYLHLPALPHRPTGRQRRLKAALQRPHKTRDISLPLPAPPISIAGMALTLPTSHPPVPPHPPPLHPRLLLKTSLALPP